MKTEDKKTILGLLSLTDRLERLGGQLLQEGGAMIVRIADDLDAELREEAGELIEQLVGGARTFGYQVEQLGAYSVSLTPPVAAEREVEQAEAVKPSQAHMSAALSNQLFELADVWRGLGLRAYINDAGDLVFCRPVGARGEEVCATVSGGLIKRLLVFGRAAVVSLIKRVLRAVGVRL